MKKTNLFKSLQVIVYTIIVIIVVIFIGGNFLVRYINLQHQIQTTQEEHQLQEKTFVRQGVNNFIKLIQNTQSKTNNRAQKVVQERVEDAYHIAMTLYHQYKDKKPDTEIQRLIIENLRAIRYNKNMGYFFVFSKQGTGLLFPLNPNLENAPILSIKNSQGRAIFKDMINIAQNTRGFYTYTWDHPVLATNDHVKISYLKEFEPYDWIIGTGIYLDEIIESLQKEALELAKHYQFGENEAHYLYIGRWDGTILQGPGQGKNMWDITDANGLKIVQELIHKAKEEGGFVQYEMPALDGKRSATKIGYAQGLHQWEWYIGSGVYLDKINQEIIHLKNELFSQFYQSLLLTIFFSILVIFFFIYILNRYYKRLLHDFGTFKHFFKQAANSHKPINKDELSLEEFDSLADHANVMIEEQTTLENSLKRLATVFKNTHEAIVICSPDNTIIATNQAFTNITGYAQEEILHKHIAFLKSDQHPSLFYNNIREELITKGTWQGELWHKRKDNSVYPAWLTISASKNIYGKIDHYIGIFSDITHLKESQKKLDFLAHHDPLTTLPNRHLFNDRLKQSINYAEHHHTKLALCFIDLDNFKNVNDSYGHSYGDEILMQVAQRLITAIRKSDTLARVGGDEFILILNDIDNQNKPAHIVSKLLNLFDVPFHVKEYTFFITASIGISLFPDDGETYETLVKNADAAMYEAKSQGKNTFAFYTKQLTADSMKRLKLENNLKHAITNKEFQVYYQPQINLHTQKLIGFEALVRWQHPNLGIISPTTFIPLAEETRMIIPIGEYVLHQVCQDWHLLNQEGFEGHIAVNISGIQINHNGFLPALAHTIKEHKIAPEKIELEITESILMNDPQKWIALLHQIKKMGLRISIDDFGTGYSSLNNLRHLPIDKLKIDISFVKDLPYESSACAIATSIIDLAKNMHMSTLAEGIETPEQSTYLQSIACEEAQGYLFAKPMPLDDLKEWLRTSDFTAYCNRPMSE